MMDGITRTTMVPVLIRLFLGAMVTLASAGAYDCPEMCSCKDDGGEITADCSNQNLTAIPTGFDEFTVELNFAGNNLTTIDQNTFFNFTQLRKLDLSRCRIEDIGVETFLPLSATLDKLILEHNLLTEIVAGTFSQLQLERLILSDNPDLQDISEEAFSGSSIDRLDLNRCNLSTLQNGTLNALRETLQHLSLSNNGKNPTLPARLFEGFTLDTCIMENNTLTSLEFLYGSSIRVLEVNHNPIGNSILGVFEHVDGIEELYASNTDITQITISITANQTVYVLDLSNNAISTLDPQQFQYFPSLVTLDVAGNQISTIPSDLHQYLPSLTYADFSSNQLMVINPDAFKNLQIKLLDLNSNQIQTIPESFQPILNKMQTFKLESNPLHCNCELLWFAQWIKSLTLGDTDVHVDDCMTPERKPLLNLRDMEFRCTAPLVLFVAPDSIEPGKRVSLHCKAKGDPPPEIKIWSSVSNVTVTAGAHPNKTLQQNELVYHITEFDCEGDFGEYGCTASNVAGEVTEEVTINNSSIAQDSSCIPIPKTTPKPTTPDATPDTGAATDDDSDDDNNTGYIVAIVVCVVLLLVILVIFRYCCWQRKNSQTYKLDSQRNGETKVHYTNEAAYVADTI